MTKLIILGLVLLVPNLALAEYANNDTFCKDVNSTGHVPNAAPQAQNMNKWLKRKGAKIRLSTKEVTNHIKRYCKEYPLNIADEVATYLVNTVDLLVEAEK